MKALFLICFVLLLLNLNCQLENINELYSFGSIEGFYHIANPLGGFYITGHTIPKGHISQKILLIRTDSKGKLTWINFYEGIDVSIGHAVVPTFDNGAIIAGTMNNTAFALRVDSLGKMKWKVDFSQGTSANSLVTTDKMEIVVAGGKIIGSDQSQLKQWIARLSFEGEIEWEKYLSRNYISYAYEIIQTMNSGYATIGYMKDPNDGVQSILFTRYGSEGYVDCVRNVSNTSSPEHGIGFVQENENSFVILSESSSLLFWLSKPQLTRIDKEGEIEDIVKYKPLNFGSYEPMDIIKTLDGGFAITGTWQSWGRNQIFVMKFDKEFSTKWDSYFNIDSRQKGATLAEEETGRLSVLGNSYSKNKDETSIWLVSAYCGGGTFWKDGKCQLCPIGKYLGPGLGYEDECLPCNPGSYSKDPGASQCDLCSEGTFNNAKGMSSCTKCSKGQQAPDKGLTKCSPCPVGTYADEEGTGKCPDCIRGMFNPKEGQEKCQPCNKGEFAPDPGAVFCRKCDKGTYANQMGSEKCIECEKGKYNPIEGQEECQLCDEGMFGPDIGSTKCYECPHGTFSGKKGAIECTDCNPGYFSKGNAAKCDECDKGTWSGSRADECTPCAAGYYNPELAQPKCKACPRDTYNQKEGAQSESDCQKCPNNLHSYYGSKSCMTCENGRRSKAVSTHSYYFELKEFPSKCYEDYCPWNFIESSDYQCLRCHEGCAECSEPFSSGKCTLCYDEKILEDGECVPKRSIWYFFVIGGAALVGGIILVVIICKKCCRRNIVDEEEAILHGLREEPNRLIIEPQNDIPSQPIPPQPFPNVPLNQPQFSQPLIQPGFEPKSEEARASISSNDDPTKRKLCDICCAKPITMVLNPCGHRYCEDCAVKFRTCPQCRRVVESAFKYF